MDAYQSFAGVYDQFMDNVPYDGWSDRIHRILLSYGIDSGLVLDLGCGTGQMTRRLRNMGYDMIGVDGSPDMLQIALEKEEDVPLTAGDPGGETPQGDAAARKQGPAPRILYLEQDIRAFELYGTVRAVISVCDCLNYLGSAEDLLQVFRLAENYLDPGGVLVFDMNTEHYYSQVLGQNTYADVRDECSVIWENDNDPEQKEHEYDLTIFLRRESGLYERSQETHIEKAYSPGTVKSLAEQAGLIFEGVYDGYTERKLSGESDRMVFVFRESDRKLRQGR